MIKFNIENEIEKLKGLELTDEQKKNQLNDLIKLSSKIDYDLNNMTYEEKTKLCRILIDKIEIDNENVEITLLIPIEGGKRSKGNYKSDLVKEFFDKENSFLDKKIISEKVNSKDYLLCNVNGRL